MKLQSDGLPPLRAVIEQFGLSAQRALGQNFLLDLNLTRRIARAAAPLGLVIEVGPGPGGLTRALLLEGAEKVIAIERDQRCAPALAQIAERWPGQLDVIMGDALKTDFPALALAQNMSCKIVANLPYNIGTELLVRWLGGGGRAGVQAAWWQSLTIMLQKEVAERVVAKPGNKAYGRLAVLTQWQAEARILFDVSPQAFTPAPKVTSAILQVKPLAQPQFPCALASLEKVTAAAFGQRRKMLRSSLKSLGVDSLALCQAANISAEARAETIDLEGFCALAQALDDLL